MVDPRRDVRLRVIATLVAVVVIGFAPTAGIALAGNRTMILWVSLALAFAAAAIALVLLRVIRHWRSRLPSDDQPGSPR